MNLRQLLLVVAGLFGVVTAEAVAQTEPAVPMPPPRVGVSGMAVSGMDGPGMAGPGMAMPPGSGGTFQFIAAGPAFGGELVTGSPYSAEAVTETQQTLADGNRINRSDSSRIYRDSQGRTRREQSISALGPWSSAGESTELVFINDPVAGVNYVLNTRDRTARKTEVHLETVAHKIERIKAEEGAVQWKMKDTAAAPEDAGATLVFRRMERKMNLGGEGLHDVTVVHSAGAAGVRFSEENIKTEPLGKQMIEGVEAEGVRVTTTIPAGQIGNDRPIEIVSESWHSAQLKTLVLSRHRDPRMGETTYRLTNIELIEPLASMFEVPPDYTIEEAGGSMYFQRWFNPAHEGPGGGVR